MELVGLRPCKGFGMMLVEALRCRHMLDGWKIFERATILVGPTATTKKAPSTLVNLIFSKSDYDECVMSVHIVIK